MNLATGVKRLSALQKKNDIAGAIDFLSKRDSGFPALHAIVMSGWTELMEQADMCDIGETMFTDVEGHHSVLHRAASASTAMLRATLLRGVDRGMFEMDEDGYTPAMIAVDGGKLENLKLLVRAGADLDQTDMEIGRNALELAAIQGNTEILRYLLDAGADATLLDMGVLQDEDLSGPVSDEVVEMLKEARAIRSAMDLRRFKTIEVDMGAGEADMVLPAAIEHMGNLFISDVIGDLASDAKKVQMEHGKKAFSGRPSAPTAEPVVGATNVGDWIERKKAKAETGASISPNGRKAK